MRASPGAGRVFVRFSERRIDVDGAEDLVEADAVLHRRDELDDELARLLADDRGAQDAVGAGLGQHLHPALGSLVDDRTVELGKLEHRRFVRDATLLCLGLVQPDARHLWIGEGGPRDDRIIGAKTPERAEERVDRRVPRLV